MAAGLRVSDEIYEWISDGKKYRATSFSEYGSLTYVVEVCDTDARGGERWVESTRWRLNSRTTEDAQLMTLMNGMRAAVSERNKARRERDSSDAEATRLRKDLAELQKKLADKQPSGWEPGGVVDGVLW